MAFQTAIFPKAIDEELKPIFVKARLLSEADMLKFLQAKRNALSSFVLCSGKNGFAVP